MKKAIVTMLAMLLVCSMTLFAAGSNEEAATDKPVTLSVWSGYPEMEVFFKHAAEEYKKLHPNVSVEVLTHPLREYEQKLSATIPSDTAADILDVSGYAFRKFIEAGFVPKAPPKVLEFIDKQGRYSDFAKNTNTFKGDKYGVPFFQGKTVLYWNTEMFKAAGLTRAPTTLKEMAEYAKKLAVYDASGNLVRSGHSLRVSGQGSGVAEKWWFVLYPMGGTIIKEGREAGKYHAGYDNDAGRRALDYYLDALYLDKWDSLKIKHDAEAFQLEQTAMFFRESWVVGDTAKKAPNLKYDTAFVPADTRWGRITNFQNLYVTRSSKNPEIAWDFIQFLVNDANQKWMFDNVGWLPTRMDVDFTDILNRKPQMKAFVESPKGYEEYGYIPMPAFDEIMTKLAERLVMAFLDESLAGKDAAIAKVISDAATETNAILRKAGLYGE